MELVIQIKNDLKINFSEIKLFLELYHLLIPIYFYYTKIYIYCNKTYILFNQQLFFNLNNICIEDIKYNKNGYIYTNIDDLIKNLNINQNLLNLNNKLNKYILRNSEEENYYYTLLSKKT